MSYLGIFKIYYCNQESRKRADYYINSFSFNGAIFGSKIDLHQALSYVHEWARWDFFLIITVFGL